jgi:hypothetical protein
VAKSFIPLSALATPHSKSVHKCPYFRTFLSQIWKPLATETVASVTETIAWVTETIAFVAETIASLTETLVPVTDTVVIDALTIASVTETIASVTETIASVTETGACVAETGASVTESVVGVAERLASLTKTVVSVTPTLVSVTETIVVTSALAGLKRGHPTAIYGPGHWPAGLCAGATRLIWTTVKFSPPARTIALLGLLFGTNPAILEPGKMSHRVQLTAGILMF